MSFMHGKFRRNGLRTRDTRETWFTRLWPLVRKWVRIHSFVFRRSAWAISPSLSMQKTYIGSILTTVHVRKTNTFLLTQTCNTNYSSLHLSRESLYSSLTLFARASLSLFILSILSLMNTMGREGENGTHTHSETAQSHEKIMTHHK